MASTITATTRFDRNRHDRELLDHSRFDRDNVTPLWKERRHISVRPVECAGSSTSAYRSRRSRHAVRTEPSASLGKRVFDIVTATAALLFLAPLATVLLAVAVFPILYSFYIDRKSTRLNSSHSSESRMPSSA